MIENVEQSDALVNIEAEAMLLGTLMQENRDFEYVADLLTETSFVEPVHSSIFSAIAREINNGRSANPVSLRGYFVGDEAYSALGTNYLAWLTAETSLFPTPQLAQMLADLERRRTMRAGLSVAASACSDLSASVSEIIGHADAAVSSKADASIHQPTGLQAFDELLESFKNPVKGVTSHVIRSLDRLLGPMKPKQLIIGAGRPGMGKTALALSYAVGAAEAGHGVMFVSLEMSAAELSARMASDLCFSHNCKIEYSKIRDGDLDMLSRNDLARAREFMRNLPFQIIDAGSLTVGRLNTLIRRHARRMEAKGQSLDLVVVDYLQLLSPDGKGKSAYEAVSEISRALKAMAKDHNVAILALAQLSRSVEQRPDKRPTLSDLRDSGQIEQDADAVLFLKRDEYYLRQNEPDHFDTAAHEIWKNSLADCEGKIEFILAKRRNGMIGSTMGQFYGAYQAVRG